MWITAVSVADSIFDRTHEVKRNLELDMSEYSVAIPKPFNRNKRCVFNNWNE